MKPTVFDLSGRSAIVTGAGRGIGRACARVLAANGARVALAARGADEIDRLAEEIASDGGVAIAVRTDVTRRSDVESLVDQTIDAFGGIDVLVNNAGVFQMKPLVPTPGWTPGIASMVPGFETGLDDEDWYRIVDTNLTGVYRCCQAVAPHMMRRKYGRIINISSIDAEHGLAFATAYCASKGALRSFSKALAREWVRYNITVNCVAPGYTDTGLFPPVASNEELKAETARRNVPMRRFADPEEIAYPVLYLASDQARYVTGESIVIDGGVLA